jgi:hypothetical protein
MILYILPKYIKIVNIKFNTFETFLKLNPFRLIFYSKIRVNVD